MVPLRPFGACRGADYPSTPYHRLVQLDPRDEQMPQPEGQDDPRPGPVSGPGTVPFEWPAEDGLPGRLGGEASQPERSDAADPARSRASLRRRDSRHRLGSLRLRSHRDPRPRCRVPTGGSHRRVRPRRCRRRDRRHRRRRCRTPAAGAPGATPGCRPGRRRQGWRRCAIRPSGSRRDPGPEGPDGAARDAASPGGRGASRA